MEDAVAGRRVPGLPDAVVIMDVEGRLSAVNEQAVAMLGYGNAAELLVKSVFDVTPAQHHERIRHGGSPFSY